MKWKLEDVQKGPLQKWAVPHDQLPPKLFLVLHPGPQHSYARMYKPGIDWNQIRRVPQFYNILGGVRAPCPTPLRCLCTMTNIAQMCEKMRQHLNWDNRHFSCFISTFSGYDAALRWGQGFDWGHVSIFHINTSPQTLPPMPSCYIFRPSDFDVRWPKDEFLFFHQIPHGAIAAITNIPLDYRRRYSYPGLNALRSLPVEYLNEPSAPDPELVLERTIRKPGKRKREEDSGGSGMRKQKRTTTKVDKQPPLPPAPLVKHGYMTRRKSTQLRQSVAVDTMPPPPPPPPGNGEGVSGRRTRRRKGKKVDESPFPPPPPPPPPAASVADEDVSSNTTNRIRLRTNTKVDELAPPTPRPTPTTWTPPTTPPPVSGKAVSSNTRSRRRKNAEVNEAPPHSAPPSPLPPPPLTPTSPSTIRLPPDDQVQDVPPESDAARPSGTT